MIRTAARAAVVIAALAVAVAGCTSAKPSATVVKGTEVFTSAPLTYAQMMSSKPAVFHLTYAGPVATTGTFSTGGAGPKTGQHHTFVTRAGNLVAVVTAVPENRGNGSAPVALDKAACRYGGITKVSFSVLGAKSTGKFRGASGTGQVTALFAFTMPRLKSGRCDLSGKAQPLKTPKPSGTFDGSVRLTLAKGHAKGK